MGNYVGGKLGVFFKRREGIVVLNQKILPGLVM